MTNIICCNLPPIWIHAWHHVNSGGVDQLDDVLVACQVGGAQVVCQVKQQLTTKHLYRGLIKLHR